MEFSTPTNGESESTLASCKLHGKVLVVLSQMGVNLLVLLVVSLIGVGGALLLAGPWAPGTLRRGPRALRLLDPRIGRSGMDTLNSEA